ncbi:MAG: hypothetical protein ACK5NG_06850 [Chthoniobacterales bacterium]
MEKSRTLLKNKHPWKKWLFIIPALAMLIVGFGMFVMASFGPRLHSHEGQWIPLAMATAGLGGALLTRSAISVFFLFVCILTTLAFTIGDLGFLHPFTLFLIALLPYCIVLIKNVES